MAQDTDIIDVPQSRIEEATQVLLQAFGPDPLMQYLFEVSKASYERSLEGLMRYSCSVRLHLEWPLLGLTRGGRLLGVLGPSMPEEAPWPAALARIYQDLGDLVGSEAITRLEGYGQLADVGRPQARHYHIGVVGVLPEAQGRGVGGALLKAIHDMSAADSQSVGVALDTENADSRRFYEHLGYHCASEQAFGPVTIWNMFRPDE